MAAELATPQKPVGQATSAARPAEAAQKPPVLQRFTNAIVLDGVKVTINHVGRWRGGDLSGPDVQVKLSSPELAGATATRAYVTEAKDDAGNVLQENQRMVPGFVPVRKLQAGLPTGLLPGELREYFGLIAAGKPKAVSQLKATIEVVLPSKDPASVVTASFAKDAGAPLQDAALKAAGLEITLLKPGEASANSGTNNGVPYEYWRLDYKMKGPPGKIAAVLCFDAPGGKVIGESSPFLDLHLRNGTDGTQEMFMVPIKPTPEIVVKFYLITEKSVVAVPIDLKDIAVP